MLRDKKNFFLVMLVIQRLSVGFFFFNDTICGRRCIVSQKYCPFNLTVTVSTSFCDASETTANPSSNSMLVVRTNIVSLQKNFDNLKQFFSQFKRNVDVICLSETRLSDHNLSCCFLPGYRLFYYNSKTKAGGSAIYVSDVIKCKQLSIKISTDGCEDVWGKLCIKTNHLL